MIPEGLVEFLRDVPEDFVLDWYCDGMDPNRPWESHWVDIMIYDNWAFAITSGLLEDDDGEFVWPPDIIGHCLIDPNESGPNSFVGPVPQPIGETPTDELITKIRSSRSKASADAYWVGIPCWSAVEINRAIEDWCIRHVGRAIQARWDAEHPLSPQMAHAVETLKNMKDGIEPTYLVHPGANEGGEGYSIYVSDQVMDILMNELAEPDE